jgi:hypothetical protein
MKIVPKAEKNQLNIFKFLRKSNDLFSKINLKGIFASKFYNKARKRKWGVITIIV